MTDLSTLNQQYGIGEMLQFTSTENGMVVAEVDNAFAKASIALQGAQVISWAPQDEEPVIWMSPEARLIEGKSMRGGVPVCWPWFGAHESEVDFPAHGFARAVMWRVVGSSALEDGRTEIIFELAQNDNQKKWWPHNTSLQYRVIVGETLELELTTQNNSDEMVVIGQALHTYFQVGDVRGITVGGLVGRDYLDKVADFARKTQSGEISFVGETDRIYLDSEDECVIRDSGLQRSIHIAKRGSRSTVVWNPWIEKCNAMGDLGDEGYLNMVCVESANAADDVVELLPGTSHTLWVSYRVQH